MEAVSQVLDADVVKIQKAEDRDNAATEMIAKVEELSESLGEVAMSMSFLWTFFFQKTTKNK